MVPCLFWCEVHLPKFAQQAWLIGLLLQLASLRPSGFTLPEESAAWNQVAWRCLIGCRQFQMDSLPQNPFFYIPKWHMEKTTIWIPWIDISRVYRCFLLFWQRKADPMIWARIQSTIGRSKSEAREKNPNFLWIWKPINLSFLAANCHRCHGCHRRFRWKMWLSSRRLRQRHPLGPWFLGMW